MYKIAFVEDEEDLNSLIKTYLEHEGYEVTSYLNGTDAIKDIDENPDLWILDIMLPGDISGYDIIKKIREKNDVLLHNLESNDSSNGDIKIKAYITTAKKNNDVVESIIVHIGKDEGIISAGWKITE